MANEMVHTMSIEPSIVSYALIKTNCSNVDAAMDLIFERGFDRPRKPGRMQHPFVAYYPETEASERYHQRTG